MTGAADPETSARPPASGAAPAWLPWAVGIALMAITAAAFWAALGFDFVRYDDPIYTLENPRIPLGLTQANVRWAFVSFDAFNWHPVTWLSLLLDVELFGYGARSFHRTNVLIHAAAVGMLFAVLHRTTGSVWRSALAAALFGWHPLRAESVAWISQRKDVLSAFFFFLAIYAYAAYAARRTGPRMLATTAAAALAVMSKPSAVTLPVVLLLLDVWPLARREPLRARVLEKLPIFAVAAIGSLLTLGAQQTAMSIGVPLGDRLVNAAVSAARYLGLFAWPRDLSPFYPFHPISLGAIALSIVVLALVSEFVLRRRASEPWLAVGWAWYGVTLLPMIGVIQVGAQAMADRYTYLPSVGIAIALAFGLPALLARFRLPAPAGAAGAALVLGALWWACREQVEVWRNGETLFGRMVALDDENAVGHGGLGDFYRHAGRLAEAEPHLRRATELDPTFAAALANLTAVLIDTGRSEEAEALSGAAVARLPDDVPLRIAHAMALLRRGRLDAARAEVEAALALSPGHPSALAALQQVDEAARRR